jgi:hemoglobin
MNSTKKDIEGRRDIEELVDRFYEKVGGDPDLGPIFNDVARVDWDEHLPKMYAFWSSILFGEGSYKGDPMAKHIQLAQKMPLDEHHFERWVGLFQETLEARFEGPMAEHVLHRARSIAGIMQQKVKATEA